MSIRNKRVGVLAALLAVLVALCAPVMARAEEGAVASYGGEEYATLEEALDAANASDDATGTVTVLRSCVITKSITINEGKDLTITADASKGIVITDTGRYGMCPNGSLTMENVTFNTNGQIALNGTYAGPFGREIVFSNVTLNMDGDYYEFNKDGYYCNAIFADTPALFVFDHCTVDIREYPKTGAGIRWNGKNNDRGYGVEMINGTKFTVENCYGGFVGTLDMLVDESELNVINNRGYGSNGTFYTISGGSDVLFDGNVDWGISANELKMIESSTLTATNNGRSGVWARAINVDSTCTLIVECNGYNFSSDMSQFESSGSFGGSTGAASNAGITYWGKSGVQSVIEAGATVSIKDNAGPGIAALQGICNLTINAGAITHNGLGNGNGENPAIYGGGIFSIGTIVVGESVQLYNNHATKAGDDIYSQPTNNTKSFSFCPTQDDWELDGEPDCTDAIDGWYLDGVVANAETEGYSKDTDERWATHVDAASDVYAEELVFDRQTTVTGVIALKAAHGVTPATATLEGSKTLTGRDMAEGEFSFVLRDSKGKEVETVSNAADGTFAFTGLSYGLAEVGEYTYTISEVIPADAVANVNGEIVKYEDAAAEGISAFTWTKDGVTYDTHVVDVTVNVGYDKDTAAVTAEVSYSTEGGAQFTNAYAVSAVTSDGFVAKKVLEGAELGSGQFTFQLLDADGKVVETVKNDASGAIVFSGISFDEAGTYEYTVVEVNDGQKNVTYDKSELGFYVVVTDNGDGTLTAESWAHEEPVFTNVYTKPAAPVTPEGTIPATGDVLPTAGVMAALAACGIAVVAGARVISKRRG